MEDADCKVYQEDGNLVERDAQTLLPQQYGVKVEEVFYWWQLLGHDVHATLAAMGAFRPVATCLRLPLATLLCAEEPSQGASGIATSSMTTSVVETPVSSITISSTAADISTLAAAKRNVQEDVPEPLALDSAGERVCSETAGASTAAAIRPAAGASRRSASASPQERWRVPFLLPFADVWGQLHGATANDKGESARRSCGRSRSNRSRMIKRGSSGISEKADPSPLPGRNVSSCCCTRSDELVRFGRLLLEKERSVSGFPEPVCITSGANNQQKDAGELADYDSGHTSLRRVGNSAAGNAPAPHRNYMRWPADSFDNDGECPASHESADATTYITVHDVETGKHGPATLVGEDRKEPGALADNTENGGHAFLNMAEDSSFFACGLQDDKRTWMNTGIFWSEGDLRIRVGRLSRILPRMRVPCGPSPVRLEYGEDSCVRLRLTRIYAEKLKGVDVEDVVRALREADGMPMSKAKEIRPSCIYARQRHFLYQRLRVQHFRLLLAQLPRSRPRLLQEANVDIPPLLRPPIWAALLELDYEAEAAAGSFLSNHAMLEAPLLPSLAPLATVNFSGCHEYHDLLGSGYGTWMLRRLLQAIFVRGTTFSVTRCALRSPPSNKLALLRQPGTPHSAQHPLSIGLECFQKVAYCEWLLPHTTSKTLSLFKETTDSVISGKRCNSVLYDTGESFPAETQTYDSPSEEPNAVSARCAHAAHAPLQPPPSVRGLDALAAPFLLLYEDHPQLALLSLQRFLVRHEQQMPPPTWMPVDAVWTGPCAREQLVQPDLAAHPSVQMKRQGSSAAARYARRGSAAPLQNQLRCYSQLLAFVDPVIAAHLSKRMGLKPETYAVPWLLTFFSHALELHQLYLLWDVALLRCPGFVLFVAVSLVHSLRAHLLKLGAGDELAALALLQNATAFVHVPALSAAAVALQDATPPSIVSSCYERFAATQTNEWQESSAKAAACGCSSVPPESAAYARLEHTRPAATDRTLSPHTRRQRPTDAWQGQRRRQRVHRRRYERKPPRVHQQHKHHQQQQSEKDAEVVGAPVSLLLSVSTLHPISPQQQQQEYISPEAKSNAVRDVSCGATWKQSADAGSVKPEMASPYDCRCGPAVSTAQRFYIGGTGTLENGEEAADAQERTDSKDASVSGGTNSHHAETSEQGIAMPQGKGMRGSAEDQQLRKQRAVFGFQLLQRGIRRGIERRKLTLLKRQPQTTKSCSSGASAGEIESEHSSDSSCWEACSVRSVVKEGAEAKGRDRNSAGNRPQKDKARAWDVVAAVIRGPALMLLGPPRKVRHHTSYCRNAEAPLRSSNSNGRPSATNDQTDDSFWGHAEGERKGLSFLQRSADANVLLLKASPGRQHAGRPHANADPLSQPLHLQRERPDVPSTSTELAASRSFHSCGFPVLTLEDYIQYGGAATVLDVRSPSSFSQAHLLDAVNVSPSASSSVLADALATAAAAAAAMRIPFPTVLLDAESSDSSDAQPSGRSGEDTTGQADEENQAQAREDPAEKRRRPLLRTGGAAELTSVAAHMHSGVGEGFFLGQRSGGKAVSEMRSSTARTANGGPASREGTAPTWWAGQRKRGTWEEAAARENAYSQPWVRLGLRRLHLVIVMGNSVPPAAKLASRLRDSGVPHVCILRGDKALRCEMLAGFVTCAGPAGAESA